ncbi:ABC transporter ATP-binding protein [Cohnella sp. AR92]|uniref:ABC transporter ATP-binding protein n=1 Tax=Cohnella sp. AR92 TaxID=648716 RepID=UPI000F8C4447|nr:ABC transporter ATP-binding protein [Cohnella sp. AR92]RUS49093.1 ABC transporter ATP-binding protein [Cohnella sp. AR92]
MTKLLRYLKPYRAAAIAAPLLMALEVVMDLLQPRFMASIVNDGVMKNDLGHIGLTGIWMILAAIGGLLGGMGCTYFAIRASVGFGTDLRNALFRKVQTFAFRELDRFSGGTLVTRLTNDVMQVQMLVQIILRMLIRSGLLFFGSIAMAFLISPKLSLIFAVTLPLFFVFLYALLSKSIPLYRTLQAKLDRVNSVLQENLSGIRVVKAFVRAAFERARFKKANEENYETGLRAARLLAVNNPVMTLLLNASIVCILWAGGAQTWEGSLAIGSLAAFLTYVTQTLNAMVNLGNSLVNISRAKASSDRIVEVLAAEASMEESPAGMPVAPEAAPYGQVEFRGVSFGYAEGGEEPVLKEISFIAKPGQTIGILGSTGAGKSTLVNLLPRLYDPTEGTVLVNGIDVKSLSQEELRGQVGIVLQQAVLFSGTIRDNIRYGRPDASREEVESAARAAEAHDFILSFPEGYDTEIGQRGITLSGGQKQRISIARALLAKPNILILDDSTSAVDLRTEARIRAALKARMAQCTCFIIAQRISSVADADRILVLEDGRIVAEGSHDELMAASDVYRDIYDSQLGLEEASHA